MYSAPVPRTKERVRVYNRFGPRGIAGHHAPSLLSVPHSRDLGVPHLALQLEDAVHEGLAGGRTAGNIDIDGHDSVATADDAVAVVVVAATVGAATHADDPSGLGHLIVDLAQGRGHLVGEGAGDDHDIGLTRRGTENDSQPILIVSWRRQVHHLDGTAGKTKGHGPQRTLSRPVGDLVERGPVVRGW
jgi:hypothetical protein